MARVSIPPAWKDVWVCPHPRGHLQATGRDDRGRKQYIYHSAWQTARNAEKFENLYEFGRALPRVRRAVARQLARQSLDRQTLLAAIVSLLDRTLVRVGNEEYARANGLTIMARVTGYATGAMDPQDLFFAPITAVRNLMEKTRTSINDFDLIEANEAFASQALADGDQLGWAWDRVNVNGGAIALGHPIGASGARVLTTLLYALEDRNKERGLATLCLGGGDAVALSVERVN